MLLFVLACCAPWYRSWVSSFTGTKQRSRLQPIHRETTWWCLLALVGRYNLIQPVRLWAKESRQLSNGVGVPQTCRHNESTRSVFPSFCRATGCMWSITCALYSNQGASINEVIYKLFHSRFHSTVLQLPPTNDALEKHVVRACYQAAIWRRGLVCNPDIPSPDLHGCILKENQLHIDWMSQLPAQHEIPEFISCGCKSVGSCTSGRCSCFRKWSSVYG